MSPVPTCRAVRAEKATPQSIPFKTVIPFVYSLRLRDGSRPDEKSVLAQSRGGKVGGGSQRKTVPHPTPSCNCHFEVGICACPGPVMDDLMNWQTALKGYRSAGNSHGAKPFLSKTLLTRLTPTYKSSIGELLLPKPSPCSSLHKVNAAVGDAQLCLDWSLV